MLMWRQGMVEVVKRTGHSSYYVEKGMAAMGRTPAQMGIKADHLCGGGMFLSSMVQSRLITRSSISNMAKGRSQPVASHARSLTTYTQNAPCCPIAIAACYSGSSVDDHHVSFSHIHPGLLICPTVGRDDN